VVAYLALFVALGGTAYAAKNPVFAGDPAGGDLAGTYPNPTLRSGALQVERVSNVGPTNSDSPKVVTATCPAGKTAIGTGAEIFGADTGSFPELFAHVIIDRVNPVGDHVEVLAEEDDGGTAATWSVGAIAICAKV
jgi:hypothetical protein